MLDRLVGNWVYGGVLAGLLLLLLLPVLTTGWSTAETLTFLCLPAYMLHQYEEHDDDRFRRFVNAEIGGGVEVLTPLDVFVINIVGVWAVLAAVIALTNLAGAGWGVLAAYLLLVNALVHVGPALAMRKPNPGLFTAVALFLPLGLALLRVEWPIASPIQQACGAALAVALHAAIIIHVKRALRAQRRPGV
ncbi:HXXEE domain-containing protein [Alsobacter sp. R-9]